MSPEAQIRRMKERATERYDLVAVPGRPEELVRPRPHPAALQYGVSFAYAGGEIRVRPMIGRNWIDELVTDFKVREGWSDKLYRLLDQHFGAPRQPGDPDEPLTQPTVAEYLRSVGQRRPIRDNPQA